MNLNNFNISIFNYYISCKYEIEFYNKLETNPIIDFDNIKYYEKEFNIYKSDEREYVKNEKNFENSNYIRYIYFFIDFPYDFDAVFTIHNNYKQVKLWIDNKYESFLDNWYTRCIVKAKKR